MQAGCPLLTDDILAVEKQGGRFIGHPGYPQMRLWPTETRRFLPHCRDLPKVHPQCSKRRVPVGTEGGLGDFCRIARPIHCVYLPERRAAGKGGKGIRITSVSPREAVIEAIRRSFMPRLVEAIGLQPQRLRFFAQMFRRAPMRRISFPSGFQHLPRVRDAILDDLRGLRSGGAVLRRSRRPRCL
jgi:hypothetical protein